MRLITTQAIFTALKGTQLLTNAIKEQNSESITSTKRGT